jgi:predicted Zn finger-like uncharacterized protein
MIRTVACSSCSTTFPVDPRKVPDDGVYARCSVCSSVFFVEGVAAAATASSGPSSQTFESTATGLAEGARAEAASPVDGGAKADDWVFEREPEIDPSTLHVDRLETVEEGQRQEREQPTAFATPAAPVAPSMPEPIRAAPRRRPRRPPRNRPRLRPRRSASASAIPTRRRRASLGCWSRTSSRTTPSGISARSTGAP